MAQYRLEGAFRRPPFENTFFVPFGVPGNESRCPAFRSKGATRTMCQSCIDIDREIENHRKKLQGNTDQSEVQRINELIAKLYADRVRLHRNPEK